MSGISFLAIIEMLSMSYTFTKLRTYCNSEHFLYSSSLSVLKRKQKVEGVARMVHLSAHKFVVIF